MKKPSFYFMSLIFVFVIALTAVMTSCENFLDGSDVQEKLSEMIDVANAKSYTIIVSPNESMGTFLSSGDKECKVGYTIDLQFTVNSENYIYNCLEAVSKVNPTKSRADYVEFIEMSSEPEEKSGIFKVQVKLIKESNDIMIRPNCTLIPKVTQITPDFTPSGYDQDELVQIKFNKPVDPESFGNCECVSIFSDTSDLKDEYFETPKFIENNTILVFAPKQDVHMLTPDSGKKMDITVSISFSEEKDAEGIPFTDSKTHSYRINDTFGNQQISTILIKEDDNSLTGTFDKTGELKCTVGYSIALQFTVKKSDYLFDGLVALSRADGTTELSDVVEFSILKGDADTGIYTVAAVIKKHSDDILIKPKCILLPKVEQITPDFIPTGYEQDETITIKFNKPVDPDSFGTFGCVSIFSDSGDLKSYFDTPTFADENTLLKITTNKDVHIITPDTGKKMDITVSLDFANVKDIDGISFAQNASHTYRINDSFGSQRKSKIMVRDESNGVTGSFDKTGEVECTVGYSIDLQFTVKKSEYLFDGLLVLSREDGTTPLEDTVEFETLKSDDDTGIYTIRALIKKESDDILIKPKCILIPKVLQITPELNPSGYDQDTVVQIKFNKSINPETLNANNISIFSTDTDLKKYFDDFYFTEENTVLNLAPKHSKHIITPDSGKRLDITVNADLKNVSDVDGISIGQTVSHTYRINESFSNQKKSKILVQEEANAATGTFDRKGEIECTVGCSVDLQFTVKKSDYLFDELIAVSRADGSTPLTYDTVEFEVLSADDDKGIYTVRVLIKEYSNNILIKPKCILIPKIVQVTPELNPSGYEQDTVVQIKFNKAINTETFDSSWISIFSSDTDLKNYFGSYYFTEENTILNIGPKANLHILTPDSGKRLDITVKADFAEMSDADGISVDQKVSHTYRINDSFTNQKKSRILVQEEASSATGTFDRKGEIECTVGCSVDLQFTVKKSDYLFDKLIAVSRADGTTPLTDEVEFEVLSADDDKGIYTISAHIKEESDDILIKPKCILIPKVVQITPELNPSGYDQDTVVHIKFNKSINPETLDSNNISIFSTETDLKNYFDDFYFTEENTVLNLAPKQNRHILTPDSGKRLDITVNVDLKNVSDADGISVDQKVSHTYRINDNFTNQKKSRILVQEEANAATGTFDRKGEIECTVGCSVDLQFTVKKSDYLFDRLIALSRADGTTPLTDEVEFEVLNEDSDRGIYTIRVLIKEETDDILIKPKCILIPKVVQITPELNPSGYDQDTVVQIRFNKSINPETLNTNNISIFSTETDLKNYFADFYFTEENTVLNLAPKQNRHILVPDSGKRLDITVNVDLKNVSDADGISVDQKVSHTYRINDSFTNQKKSRILVQEEANSATGTFDRKGEIECTVGCSVDLQFTVKKSDYLFDQLVAVSRADGTTPLTDEVEFEVLKRDAETGIYTIRVLIKQETNNILIKPKCILIPKIEHIEPDYESSGCEQDSTISIVFNKPVDISAYFNPTITDASGNNLAEYFAQPYFSDDSTTLYIPTVKSKRLINVNGSIETKDIIVKIDLSDISDKDGNAGTGVFQHKYRINKHLDSISPILTGVNLYSTSNRLSKYYKQLTPKAYDIWTNLGSNDGDFGTNHIKDTVYIEADGYDVDSGIGGIIVKEKILKYTDGTVVNYDSTTAHLACTKDEITGKYYAEYKMETAYDGIVELEISVEDYAGNVNNSSQSKKFYVLKDTMVDTVNIRFTQELEPGSFPREGTEAARAARTRRMEKIPVVREDEQDVVLTINTELTNGKIGSEDYFYSNYHSPYEIEVYWGYSEDSATNRITKDSNNNYNFTRDVSRFAFIKVLCRDEVGNEKVKIKRMPPRVEICAGEQNNEISITNLQSWVVQSGVSISQQTTYNIEDYSHLIFEFEDENVNPNRVIWCGEASPLGLMRDLCFTNYENVDYPTGNVKVYASANVGDFPSPLSLNYVSFSITGWDADGFGSAIVTTPVISNETDGEKTVVQGYGPEGTDYISRNPLKVTLDPMPNTGCAKVVIDDYMTSAGQAAGITYSFYIMGWYAKDNHQAFDPSFSSLNKSPELLLFSYSGYKIFVEAYDASTKTIYRPFSYELDDILDYTTAGGYIKQNLPSFEFKLNSSTTPTKDLILREDVLPPIVTASQNFTTTVGIPGGFMINGPVDYNFDPFDESNNSNNPGYEPPLTLPVNEDGNYELTYYIIPNPSSDINFVPTYSIEELRTEYQGFKRTLEYNLAALPEVIVPYGNLAEGYYTISFIVEDIYGNADVYTFAFVNYTLGKLPYKATRTNNSITGQQELKFSIPENRRAGFKTTVNGVEQSTIYVTLASNSSNTSWTNGLQNIVYDWVMPENGQGDPVYTLTFEQAIEFDNSSPWRKVLAHTGFDENNNSASGKAYFNADYIYVGQNAYCQIKNCMEGLNGIQIFSDNSVLVHTMFSPDKLTDSKYSRNALSIWETKGAETGIMIYNTTELNGVQQDINQTYDLTKLDGVPVGCWYTTIIRFADGTVVMTDIKQKY